MANDASESPQPANSRDDGALSETDVDGIGE